MSGDTDSGDDLYERSGGTTTQVSEGAINGNLAFEVCFFGASSDGLKVFFVTDEPLVSGDTDGYFDLYERSGGTTTQVSQGQMNGNGDFGHCGAIQRRLERRLEGLLRHRRAAGQRRHQRRPRRLRALRRDHDLVSVDTSPPNTFDEPAARAVRPTIQPRPSPSRRPIPAQPSNASSTPAPTLPAARRGPLRTSTTAPTPSTSAPGTRPETSTRPRPHAPSPCKRPR